MSRVTRTPSLGVLSSLLMVVACGCAAPHREEALSYPQTATVDQVDTYHGVEVADPYRWLEEDVRSSAAVKEWVEAENEVTFA